jgi:transaldolase
MTLKKLEKNPLITLESFGQSIWLDYIRRNILVSGTLKQMIAEDGLTGLTSNPSIFEKAIAESHDYDEAIHQLVVAGTTTEDIYQNLVVSDIQQAADLFRPIYNKTRCDDGYVSLEVSPKYALDTDKTIEQAHHLWKAVDRPNLLIKVPGTEAGLPAIRQLISEGINVNVTLLFSLERYREVAAAYIAGLENRVKRGLSIDHIASVASFFLSRIDVLVDSCLEKRMHPGDPKNHLAESLHGQVAIASAKVAYQIYREIFKSEHFQTLAKHGAMAQKLLWASTSSKNPAYPDTKYVDALIGPETINTIPLETLNAYRDHGNPTLCLEDHLTKAYQVIEQLPQVGVDLKEITRQLEEEGIHQFAQPFDKLMKTLDEKLQEPLRETSL